MWGKWKDEERSVGKDFRGELQEMRFQVFLCGSRVSASFVKDQLDLSAATYQTLTHRVCKLAKKWMWRWRRAQNKSWGAPGRF